MQPFDQQSKELFDGQTQAPDLVGSPASAAFQTITQALDIAVWGPICLWNTELKLNWDLALRIASIVNARWKRKARNDYSLLALGI